jgi:hypothetical protein
MRLELYVFTSTPLAACAVLTLPAWDAPFRLVSAACANPAFDAYCAFWFAMMGIILRHLRLIGRSICRCLTLLDSFDRGNAGAGNAEDRGAGSAVNVQASERGTNVLSTETVLNNAELQAYGYRAAATGYQATAGLEKEEAAQAPIGAALGATSNLLSNASSNGAKWNRPQSQPFLGESDVANPAAIGGLYRADDARGNNT